MSSPETRRPPRVLVTRQAEQAGELREGLRALGAEVVEVPVIEMVPPADTRPLDEALKNLYRYQWVVFTSANAVASVAGRLAALEATGAWPITTRVASIGPATTAAIQERLGVRVELEPPTDYRAEGLLDAFLAHDLGGRHVLLPLSDRARDVLPHGLRARGAEVQEVVAYRNVPASDLRDRLAEALATGADLVTFASPSAVECFVAAAPPGQALPPAAVIGPVTESAARRAGLTVAAVATPATVGGLLAAVEAAVKAGWAGHR